MQRDSEIIHKLFPELMLIRDGSLREKVAKVWAKVWRQSKWQDLEKVPVNPEIPGKYTLVNHTRGSVRNAIAIAKNLDEIHGVKANNDYLVAISLLHDVSKLLEIEEREGKCVKSKDGTLFPHPYLAGYAALEMGLPKEIVHAIAVHSPALKMPMKTLEGTIMQHAERGDIDPLRIIFGLKSLTEVIASA